MKVIFLDIDGVLNIGDDPRGHYGADGYRAAIINAECVAHLNDLCERTGASLVLSSTWRLGADGLGETKRALAAKGFRFNDRFLGITPRLHRTPDGEERVRGHEIAQWLDENAPDATFVILDDDADMAHLLPRLAQTEWDRGLNAEAVARAVAVLETTP